MIIQFLILIVFAASALYILFHTPLFRKVPLIYLVVGTFITSIVLVPILYRFIVITIVIDIFLLAYIRHCYKNQKIDHISKQGNISTQIDRIEHTFKNLSLPFHYYVTIALFLLLVAAYISSESFLNLYYVENLIFSDAGRGIPNAKHEFDSYPLVIIWIFIISAGVFYLKKILKAD